MAIDELFPIVIRCDSLFIINRRWEYACSDEYRYESINDQKDT